MTQQCDLFVLDLESGGLILNNLICSNNVDLYKVLAKELANTLERQFSGNAESRAAGMVINTMGWIEGVGYEASGLVVVKIY